MKSMTARLTVFSLPGAPVVAMTATATEAEVSAIISNTGIREKPIILRASPVLPQHKYVATLRPANICDPEGRTDKSGKKKPGLIQLLDRIFLAKYIQDLKLKLPVKKTLVIFRDENKMTEVYEHVEEQCPEFDDMSTIPFVMNHGGLGKVSIKKIIFYGIFHKDQNRTGAES